MQDNIILDTPGPTHKRLPQKNKTFETLAFCIKAKVLFGPSLAVFRMSLIAYYRQAHPHLELKSQPRFCTVTPKLIVHEKNIDHVPKYFETLSPGLAFDSKHVTL